MTVEELNRVKRTVMRKCPISIGLSLSGVEIELSKSISTAAVVGEKNKKGIIEVKSIQVNPDFFDQLSFSEKVFVIAHEALHISLKHFSRSLDKPEKDTQRKYEEYCQTETDEAKRKAKYDSLRKHYQRVWNVATDACINAFLRNDGFSFPDHIIDPSTGKPMQFVDMEDGFSKSAEKIYDYLVQKEQQNHEETRSDEDRRKQSNTSRPSIDDIDVDEYDGFDSHDEWVGGNTQEGQSVTQQEGSPEDSEPIDEEELFQKELNNSAGKGKQSSSSKGAFSQLSKGLGEIKPFKPVISWKRLLVGTLEKTVEEWGTRRSSRYHPNPRIQERDYEKNPNVEVLLDVSGSVSLDLLHGFLLQLYSLFEEMAGEEITIKVGCFSSNFSGFQVIRNKQDILDYTPKIGGGTDFEVAATSFSPDPGRTTTKIVFTDGRLGTSQETRVPNIIWVVFGNKMDFVPVGGRIIKVSNEDYRSMVNESLFTSSEKKVSYPKEKKL